MSNGGKILIISSPSGGGKGTVIGEMRKLRPSLQYSVSMTTREPRPSETEGVHYRFTTRERFSELDAQGYFLESSPYSAMGNLYGTPRDFVEAAVANGDDVVLEIEVNGMRQVKEKIPEAITVFLMPPTQEDWEKQLNNRADDLSDEEKQARMETGREEIRVAREYEHIIVNYPGQPEHAAREILAILDDKKNGNNTAVK